MKTGFALTLAFTFVLAGCNVATPPCSDQKSISLVKQIFNTSLEKGVAATGQNRSVFEQVSKAVQVNVTTIRTAGSDEKIGKYTCNATLEVKLDTGGVVVNSPLFKNLIAGDQSASAVEINGPLLKHDINYTSQMTDDKKEHLVELTGHQPIGNILVALSTWGAFNVPQLGVATPVKTQSATGVPPDLFLSSDAQYAAKKLLDGIYGRYDVKTHCWINVVEGQNYCMKPDRADIVTTKAGRRLYVIARGDVIADDGTPNGSHADVGMIGAFVVEEREGRSVLSVSNPKIQMGASGVGPSKWKFAVIGYENWGWYNTWGDCHQGYCGSRYAIVGNYGGKLRDLAGFTESYDDTGACGDKACEEKSSSLESKLVIDSNQAAADIYPLQVTVSGVSAGKKLEPLTWRVPFDKSKGVYVEPSGWPLANRDF